MEITGPPKCTCDPLHKIPVDILEGMKQLAGYYGWFHANTINNKKDDAENDIEKTKFYYKQFSDYGLLSPEACELFRDMADYCSKSTAEERSGKKEIAAEYKSKSLDTMNKLIATKEVTAELADELWKLCWYSGWFAANSRKIFGLGLFHKDDAADDAKKIKEIVERIGGDCRMLAIEFFGDAAVLTNPNSRFFADQTLDNHSDETQEMCVSYSYSNTVTKSWSTTCKWKFTAAAALGGFYFVAGGIAATLSYSKSTTEGGSITDGETITCKFPVTVGPHTQVVAKAVVQEAHAEVPYFMIFEIGGKRFCKEGVWKGILAGNVKNKIGKSIPID